MFVSVCVIQIELAADGAAQRSSEKVFANPSQICDLFVSSCVMQFELAAGGAALSIGGAGRTHDVTSLYSQNR